MSAEPRGLLLIKLCWRERGGEGTGGRQEEVGGAEEGRTGGGVSGLLNSPSPLVCEMGPGRNAGARSPCLMRPAEEPHAPLGPTSPLSQGHRREITHALGILAHRRSGRPRLPLSKFAISLGDFRGCEKAAA